MTDYINKEAAEPILFIYNKEGKIKALDLSNAKAQEAELVNNGWRHNATIHAGTFIEHIYNNSKDGKEMLNKMMNF
jgi:hypothetical protein